MGRLDKDLEMIRNPLRWPYWPLLPMKQTKPGEGRGIGLITPDYPNVLIHAGLFQVNGAKLAIHQLNRDGEVEGLKTTKYQDVEAMLDDGWTVD